MAANPPIKELLAEGNPLEWSPLDRALLLLFISAYLPVVFWVSLIVYQRSELSPYLDHPYVELNIAYCKLILVCIVLLFFVGLHQRQYRRDWPFFSHLFAQGFTMLMIYATWATGFYTSNSSLLIVAGLSLGLPLLDARSVFWALVSGILVSVLLVYITEAQLLEYAPLFKSLPFDKNYLAPTWAISQFILVINTIGAVWVIMASLIKRWRVRELDLLAEMETQEKLASLGEFSARIIHQTRHQLGLMGISIHKLNKQLNKSDDVDIDMIRSELALLNDIQDKLRLSLKEELNIEPSGELTDTRSYKEVIEEEADNLRLIAQQKGVTIRLAFGEKVSSTMAAKLPEEFSQGVFNVIENALAVAQDSIAVSTSQQGNELICEIQDDGPGIPEELMDTVLKPFMTTKPDGNGMGLAIASGVVRKEGGRLELQNRPGCGLTVRFIIPIPQQESR
ncbi:MAG: HAMP domain-containing histidine kinase [Pseudomonadales bacterium]|nr:HAMP domain-containing histidine kinase [Pseudomonadales bacterium]